MDIPIVKHPVKKEWMLACSDGHMSFRTRAEALSYAKRAIDVQIEVEAMRLAGTWVNENRLEFLEWIYSRSAQRWCDSDVVINVPAGERRRIKAHIVQECRRVIEALKEVHAERMRRGAWGCSPDSLEWEGSPIGKHENGLTALDLIGKERDVLEKAIWRVVNSSGISRERVEMVVVGMLLCGDFESVSARSPNIHTDFDVANCQKIKVEFPTSVWSDIWDSLGTDSHAVQRFKDYGRLREEPERLDGKT